jgi:hypothetical protein
MNARSPFEQNAGDGHPGAGANYPERILLSRVSPVFAKIWLGFYLTAFQSIKHPRSIIHAAVRVFLMLYMKMSFGRKIFRGRHKI